MSAVAVRPLRWSSVRDCPRKAVYEATGAPARERMDKEERILHRGRTLGREYVVMLATATGKLVWVESGPSWWVPPHLLATKREYAGIIAEQPVQWALGTGHADAFVVETGTIVEVLSSANASDAMIQSKLLQAVGYCEHYGPAENVALVILNPSDFSEDRVVAVKTSQAYLALVEEMQERLATLARWDEHGEIPPRVCSKPSEARGHFCLYAETCFEGWQPPAVEEIAADETLIAAAVEFTTAKAAQSRAEKEAKAYEARKKAAQAVLEAAEIPAGRAVRIGPIQLTRTDVGRSPSFDWKAAEAAGRFEPGLLPEFFKPGASYSTFRAERVGEPEPVDYGDVPF